MDTVTISGLPALNGAISGNELIETEANGRSVSITTSKVVDLAVDAVQLALSQKAPLLSPTFTGTPYGPTAATGTNTPQLSTTAFVANAIAALVASSSAALDTLNELAAALGDDPNFSTTMLNGLASKASTVDLANSADPSKGTGMLGFHSPLAGAIGRALTDKFIGLAINPEDLGAVGDGITDDSGTFDKLALVSGHIRLSPNRVYRLTREFPVVNRHLDMNGSSIRFDLTSVDQYALRPRDNSAIYGGTVEVNTSVATEFFGDRNIPIAMGDYSTGDGYHNIRITNMTVKTNKLGGTGIIVTGDCYNIEVGNIEFPDTDKGAAAIYAEWGGTSGVSTTHPHNMHWYNLKVGTYSRPIAPPDGTIIGLSGCYNVKIENFHVGVGAGVNICPVGVKIGGGAGFAFARNPELRTMTNPNIRVSNFKIYNDGTKPGLWLYGRSSIGAKSWQSNGVVFEKGTVRGTSVANGTLCEYTRGARFVDVDVSYAANGHSIGIDVQDIKYDRGSVHHCWFNGGSVSNTTTEPRGIVFDDVWFYCNGQIRTTDEAQIYGGLYFSNCYGPEAIRCKFGINDGTETQYFSINARGASSGRVKSAKLIGNKTIALASVGTPYAYGYGFDANDYVAALPNGEFRGNFCEDTIGINATEYFGMRPLITHSVATPVSSSSSARVKYAEGPAIPTTGTWGVRDELKYTPGSGAEAVGWWGAVCTVAGTPGTWKRTGTIEA